jgi:carbohydrate-selective porin OprB
LPPARRCFLALAAAAAAFASRALAGDAAALARHLRESPALFGDAAGARPALAERGVAVDVFWNEQLGVLLRDGERGDAAHSGSLDLFVRADLARLGIPLGGQLLALVKSNHNRNVNDRVAALGDPLDDADGDTGFWVNQLWYERAFLAGRVRARLGPLRVLVPLSSAVPLGRLT